MALAAASLAAPTAVNPVLTSQWRRWAFWSANFVLLGALLMLLLFLARQYEDSLRTAELEHTAANMANDIRSGLSRNVQILVAMHSMATPNDAWHIAAADMLDSQSEIVHLEWRDNDFVTRVSRVSPYIPLIYSTRPRPQRFSELDQSCLNAERVSSAAYSPSHFWLISGGVGVELMEMCVPVSRNGEADGFLIVTYALSAILREMVPTAEQRGKRIFWADTDGTRLASYGQMIHSVPSIRVQHLVVLPGQTLVLELEKPLTARGWFPHILTVVVGALATALLLAMAFLARDLRRRQLAESKLGEALAFRKAMEDSLVTGLRARDMEGRITYVNPAFCQMVGLPADQLLGHGIPAPYWPSDQIDEYRHRQAVRLAGQVISDSGYESEFVRPDGTRFPVLIIEAPLVNATAQQTGWMSAVIDLSEQRRSDDMVRASQERLQAASRLAMAGEMASMISHELNQPLAAISSYATGSLNLLKEQGVAHSGADLLLAMQRIGEQAERAGKVIRGVTELVRRGEGERALVRIDALQQHTYPLMQLQARKLGIALQWQIDPACQTVWCDHTMIEQVLLNLARNGMQAMPPGQPSTLSGLRRLLISVSPAPPASVPMVQWAVHDFGTGIPPEKVAQLFTPFFTTKPEGMGMGLQLCRTVIEQHGSTLQYEPGDPQGSVFRFVLPAQQAL